MDASNDIDAVALLHSMMASLPNELVQKILKRLLQQYLNSDMPLPLTSAAYITDIVAGVLEVIPSLESLMGTWLSLQRTKKDCSFTADEMLAIKVVEISVEAAFETGTFIPPDPAQLDDDLPISIQPHAARIRHVSVHIRIDGTPLTSIRAHPLHSLSCNIGLLDSWFPRLRSLTISLDLPPDLDIPLEARRTLTGHLDRYLHAGVQTLVDSMRRMRCKEVYLGWRKRSDRRGGFIDPQLPIIVDSEGRRLCAWSIARFVINHGPVEGEFRVGRQTEEQISHVAYWAARTR